MRWTGKVLGAGIGFLFGKWAGLALGLFLGNLFDRSLDRMQSKGPQVQGKAMQNTFSKVTFWVMGKLCRADGVVSEQQINQARSIMERLRLSEDQRLEAMRLFNEGKQSDFDIVPPLMELKQVIGRRITLAQFFLELQLQTAYADGQLGSGERQILQTICRILGINKIQFEFIRQRTVAQQNFSNYQRHSRQKSSADQLNDAYGVLGISADINDIELKKVYRRLMSQHHPDKMAVNGLPAEMQDLAKARTQEIQHAYDLIKKSRRKGG
ncbi:co-chaperone DjlA [Gynuella sunshinyii]|uniref:DnaJ-domain-containing protein 1 n=1 Tax=Gynuella sunshinyii YC6258 TaxID=1445510 RepID=A0A0C5VV21_9GAMM|nr:co-chaperone DjlA [Gynuella sunshinyii]AJQ94229.1 dnaJ-domain-containing protein 1 [Gynuella sunshinyii YC6258]